MSDNMAYGDELFSLVEQAKTLLLRANAQNDAFSRQKLRELAEGLSTLFEQPGEIPEEEYTIGEVPDLPISDAGIVDAARNFLSDALRNKGIIEYSKLLEVKESLQTVSNIPDEKLAEDFKWCWEKFDQVVVEQNSRILESVRQFVDDAHGRDRDVNLEGLGKIRKDLFNYSNNNNQAEFNKLWRQLDALTPGTPEYELEMKLKLGKAIVQKGEILPADYRDQLNNPLYRLPTRSVDYYSSVIKEFFDSLEHRYYNKAVEMIVTANHYANPCGLNGDKPDCFELRRRDDSSALQKLDMAEKLLDEVTSSGYLTSKRMYLRKIRALTPGTPEYRMEDIFKEGRILAREGSSFPPELADVIETCISELVEDAKVSCCTDSLEHYTLETELLYEKLGKRHIGRLPPYEQDAADGEMTLEKVIGWLEYDGVLSQRRDGVEYGISTQFLTDTAIEPFISGLLSADVKYSHVMRYIELMAEKTRRAQKNDEPIALSPGFHKALQEVLIKATRDSEYAVMSRVCQFGIRLSKEDISEQPDRVVRARLQHLHQSSLC